MTATTLPPALLERAERRVLEDAGRNGNGHADPARPERTARARLLTAWLQDASLLTAPAVLVPWLAVEGRVTLLSGREKVGKSSLVGSAVASASVGADVFGSAIAGPVSALWYTTDEPVADTVRRLAALGADASRVALSDAPRTLAELHGALVADLTAHAGVGLVVVDTLSRLLARSGVDVNDAGKVEPVLAALVDELHARGVAGLLLYHTGKGGREYRGSTAIGATVDEVIVLRRRAAGEDDFDDADANDDGRRLLVADGRNLRGRIQLVSRDGHYTRFDDAHPPRERLLAALRDHGEVKSRSALAKLAGVQKQSGLHLIGELVAEGLILERDGKLTVPASGSIQRFPRSGSATPREPLAEGSSVPGFGMVPEREPRGNRSREPIEGAQTAIGSDGRRVGLPNREPVPRTL